MLEAMRLRVLLALVASSIVLAPACGDAATSTQAGGTGTTGGGAGCGSGPACGLDEVCVFADGLCGDGAGETCVFHPPTCGESPPSTYCGCDGMTHASSCAFE